MQHPASMIMQRYFQNLINLDLRIIKTLKVTRINPTILTNRIYRIIFKQSQTRSFHRKTMQFMALLSI